MSPINWSLISLELFITTTLVVLVLADLFLKKSNKDVLGNLSFVALFGMIAFWFTQKGLSGVTFDGRFMMDSLSWYFKGFFLLAMVFVLTMAKEYFKNIPQERRNEFYLLLWIALLGMCFIASSADFLMLFISIEVMTLSFYVMTAYLKRDKHSLEAGMKYLVLGALASGFFLYGISLLYGATQSTHFNAIQEFASNHGMNSMILFSLVLILAMVGFKIAAVPFHMWAPDVYQGAPTPVTAFLSVGSKAAGFVVLIRLFLGVFAPWHMEWAFILASLAAVTMTYGNLVAMFQTNIKRLFGYSSIAHAGYLLMGAAAGTVLGVTGINIYLLGYLFTNLAAFAVIILVFMATKSDEIEDYAGLSQRSAFLAATMLIALVSLAGMPPLAGFFGKFTLLMATVQGGFLWLALIAAVNIVISLYYYMMIVKKMYVDKAHHNTPIEISLPMKLILILGLIGIIGIGIFQGPILECALTAVKGLYF